MDAAVCFLGATGLVAVPLSTSVTLTLTMALLLIDYYFLIAWALTVAAACAKL